MTTQDVKPHGQGFFTCGDPAAPVRVLIVASCRGLPYLNYLHHYNETHGRPMRLSFVSPHEYEHVQGGLAAGLLRVETDERALKLIREATVFIHEHHASYGIFNESRASEKNIYRYGMKASVDILIPSFNNVFLLSADLIQYRQIPERALLSEHLYQLARFYDNTQKTDLPEFADWFLKHYLDRRLFWTFNHVSSLFTLEVFRLMNEKFLHLPLTEAFWAEVEKTDMFSSPATPYLQTDIDVLGYRWGQPVSP